MVTVHREWLELSGCNSRTSYGILLVIVIHMKHYLFFSYAHCLVSDVYFQLLRVTIPRSLDKFRCMRKIETIRQISFPIIASLARSPINIKFEYIRFPLFSFHIPSSSEKFAKWMLIYIFAKHFLISPTNDTCHKIWWTQITLRHLFNRIYQTLHPAHTHQANNAALPQSNRKYLL